MKKFLVVFMLLLVSINVVSACGRKTSDTMQGRENAIDSNIEVLDSATTLGTNGAYYESGSLQMTQGKQYVFRLTNNKLGHSVSTLYMYNAKQRMGNEFLDGTTEKQHLDSAYWNIKVYDSDKKYMDFATIHPLTSQMSWTNSWDDVYQFEENSTYYFVIDVLKSKPGNWYFSVY